MKTNRTFRDMRTEFASTTEHYDRMIDEIDDQAMPFVTDPFHDTGALRDWMAQTDGPAFWEAVGDVTGKTVMEVGVGTGRVAQKMLDRGCAHLVGIDISAKTIERAARNLAGSDEISLVQGDITDFAYACLFDIVYLVWTIFHIEDKTCALSNIAALLKPGGRLVISLERVEDWLDYGSRQIRQYPILPEELAPMLQACGFTVEGMVPVYDAMAESEEWLTTIISATKPYNSRHGKGDPNF